MVGLLAWLIPGAGHLLLKENKRALIIFATIVLTFFAGLYIGSIGIINPVGAKPWYVAQIMNSPMVAVLGYLAMKGNYGTQAAILAELGDYEYSFMFKPK